ncbi:membrane-binding protein [Acetobacterium paludosum]|uniref:Membrane-binding protein n=1 Tax=Acetobacterium paludosum TaxID=52693 RepID=A0A923HX87_9FIRM|nr:membrane-binding protein [Acetobacterium paludosum]MBC3888837.1 membrane-binding protein [Acetobacterium paludosum]
MFNQIKYEIQGITSSITYENGNIKDCRVNKPNVLHTNYGDFTPRFSHPDERKKDTKALSFYENGNIKSIALEERKKVETPIGAIKAELITFHENGSIDSLFPSNGQIGFGWSMEDETKLTEKYDFQFPFGEFSARIIAVRFYESGQLSSLILWPGEIVEIATPIGIIPIRIGFKLYENGLLESVEPAHPIIVNTPIGNVTAFDYTALGMDADFNSIHFDEKGNLSGVFTNSDFAIKNLNTNKRENIFQYLRLDMLSDNFLKVPTVIQFEKDTVVFDTNENTTSYKISECEFLILYDGKFEDNACSPNDCSECIGC